MTSSGRRVKRHRASHIAQVRRRIVAAARIEFCEHGYAGATFESIGRRVGVTRPAINHHFGSKQLLYRDVIASTEASITDVAETLRPSGEGTTLLAELSALFSTAITVEAQHPCTVAFVVSSILDAHRHLRFDVPTQVTAVSHHLAAAVQRAIRRGELGADTDVAATVALLSALLCGVGFSASARTPDDVAGVVDQMHRLLGGTLWRLNPLPASDEHRR